ncbi:MAG TPA: DJ-1/PfpI family protein [Mycobacterium sp.]|jgi:putative intracellular protease/amidase|nr:DJ-1/PfpI family protein [Mycobacterium sp.]
MTSVLIVVSAANHWTLNDGTSHLTGYWAEELAQPHQIFTAAGWDITIATPGGVAPTMDRLSLGLAGGLPPKTRAVADYLRQLDSALSHPKVLADVDPNDFDVVFYPGGHGPMEDLAVDADSGRILTAVLESGRPLALLCHGPAATLAAQREDRTWPFEGYRMTALSNAEERLNPFARKAPWLLQDRLVESGAIYSKGRLPLRPYLVVDRNLYTGQNPASSAMLAHKLVTDQSSPALHVSVSRLIPADPLMTYDVISDITTIGQRSPETHAAKWITHGKKFKGYNHIGPLYRWSTVCKVTEDAPGRTFAFDVAWPSKTVWRYDLAAADGGTEVTLTMTKMQPQAAPVLAIQRMVGVHDRAGHLRTGMEQTLEGLAEQVQESSRHPSAWAR